MTYRGQNFLKDRNYISKIIEKLNIGKTDRFFEIGCGYGHITKEIAKNSKCILAIDVDLNLIERAYISLKNLDNVNLICADFLNIKLDKLNGNLRIFGNIPYYLTNPIIQKLVFEYGRYKDIHLTVQREVGERLFAVEGGRDFGIMTALLGAYTEVKKVFSIPKRAFHPVPEVDSVFIRIQKLAEPLLKPDEWVRYLDYLKVIFHQKRKILLNNLILLLDDMSKQEIKTYILSPLDIEPGVRAEQMGVGKLVQLYEYIKNK